MQLILHETRRSPRGASRSVQARSAWSVKTRPPPSQHCRDEKVYDHTTAATHGMSLSTTPPTYILYIYNLYITINTSMCKCVFWTFARFSPAPMGLSSCSRLWGTPRARLYTTVEAWVPGGLRGAGSGRSKSRNLASNHGVAFPRS